MWNLKDSNVRVGLFMKVSRYKHHIQKLNNSRSTLNIGNSRPWSPTFSLSRNHSRYHKNKMVQMQNENLHLVRKITDIDLHPKITTLMDVPIYIPSNKENYHFFKMRQRRNKQKVISRENSAISVKISSVSKSYSKDAQQRCWQTSRIYKRNISKKQKLYDYRVLAESQIKNQHEKFNINLKQAQLKNKPKRLIVNTEKLSASRPNRKFNKIF